jgi:hypothetical protein
VDHRVFNTTNSTQKYKLRCDTWENLTEDGAAKLTLPLKEGILHSSYEGWGDFPMGDRDISKKPGDYSESWIAIENSGVVAGMVFGDCEEREDMTLQFDLPEIPPQSYYDLEKFYIVSARGNWEIVRQLWRWLKQPGDVKEKRKPIVQPALKAGFNPEPLIITRSEIKAQFTVQSLRGIALEGKWQIEGCDLEIEPKSGETQDVKRGKKLVEDLSVKTSSLSPRVEKTQVALIEKTKSYDFNSSIVILGDAEKSVEISSEAFDDKPQIISVDNGLFSFDIAPSFLGSMASLEWNGVNHLFSAYPEARPHIWFNPWFGGIQPSLDWVGSSRFLSEKFSGEPIERTGKNGILWKGVSVFSDLQHKDNRWMRMEIEYLTVGRSNVLAVVQRVINKTKAPQHSSPGLSIWPAINNEVSYDLLHYYQNRPCYKQAASTDEYVSVQRSWKLGEYGIEIPSGRWIAVEDSESQRVLTLIVSHPDDKAGAEAEKKESGSFLWTGGEMGLDPNETKETVSWLVLCDSVDEARKYRVLEEVWELP